ncbi:hypothetical protein [Enterococcus hulanensis]|uniref:hypothetical protein n=1 Tax=Enterococcus TaxID=1350 RepID=UPI0010F983C5|nr:hypothetical protein [Enterococcus hulanensis]
MDKLEKRIRQLEIQNISTMFQLSCLMDKFNVSILELKEYASKCLDEIPDSEVDSDVYLYLQGFIKGSPE